MNFKSMTMISFYNCIYLFLDNASFTMCQAKKKVQANDYLTK